MSHLQRTPTSRGWEEDKDKAKRTEGVSERVRKG